jgi:hypothetical protein
VNPASFEPWPQQSLAKGKLATFEHFRPLTSLFANNAYHWDKVDNFVAQCENLTQGSFFLQTSAQRVSAALGCVSKDEKVKSGHESAEERESPNAVGRVNAVPKEQVKHVGND